jgi:hypothetical protein
MDDTGELTAALRLLGELLADRGLTFDLVVIGGGALLLQDLVRRPTLDLDAVARIEDGVWVSAKPLPPELVTAVREVADALGLEREPRSDRDWLNGGPTKLRSLGLPDGFELRLSVLHFGPLTIRVASRSDLVTLKLWAATDSARGARRSVDVQDLRELRPSLDELRSAARWCVRKDGRSDFALLELTPVLQALGHTLGEVLDE